MYSGKPTTSCVQSEGQCWGAKKLGRNRRHVFMKLTFQSLAVSFRIARFNIQKFYMALALR